MSNELILGIDGGGTKTVAWIAAADAPADVLGRGSSGPSNMQAVGTETATDHLEQAIDAAFADAGLSRHPVLAATFGLSGADRAADHNIIREWSQRRGLTAHLQVVNDALPVLFAANPAGRGVALISGTGSFAFGRGEDGTTARAGGWGYLFGDEGSAYAIAVAGLRAAAQAADGRGPHTALLELLPAELGCAGPEGLIPAIYGASTSRACVAGLARSVFAAMEAGDAVASGLIDRAADDLAEMVAAVARRLKLDQEAFPLAFTGGVVLNSLALRDRVQTGLTSRDLAATPVICVPEPVAGALEMSRQTAMREAD